MHFYCAELQRIPSLFKNRYFLQGYEGNSSLISCFGLDCLDFEESSYSQMPGSLSPDYKYLHARQIPY